MALILTTNVPNPVIGDFVALVTPSGFQVGIMDISKAERAANGTMKIDRVATKRKLELSYAFLTKEELASVLQAVSYVTFSVRYPDPQTNAVRQAVFYCGDRSAGMLDYINGVPRYRDVKFNLIEL